MVNVRTKIKDLNYSIINIVKYIVLNYLIKRIVRSNNCFIIPMSDTIWQLDRNSKIILNGELKVGWQQVKGAKQQTRIWLEEGAELHITGNFTIGAGSFIRVWKNSKLFLQNGVINAITWLTLG